MQIQKMKRKTHTKNYRCRNEFWRSPRRIADTEINSTDLTENLQMQKLILDIDLKNTDTEFHLKESTQRITDKYIYLNDSTQRNTVTDIDM